MRTSPAHPPLADLATLPAPAGRVAALLGTWFDENARELPWRTARTPYRVWLSEVMLQQTRVSVVEEYFRRFTTRFPDVATLAAAAEDDVLSLWSGLGYYSRGRNLHKAARAIVAQHNGAFPTTAAGLAALPGIGPYTAAAVASLAFGERIAVVDGNVLRVLSRLANDATPVDTPSGQARVRTRAQALVEAAADPAKLNEGLMELGALVCTPRAPSCGACPWRDVCAARKALTQEALPVKSPKRARKALVVASVVVVDEGRVWLEKRAAGGLFGGLHEPPSRELPNEPGVEPAVVWAQLLAERGLPVPKRFPPPIVVERTLTHRDLRFAVLRVDARAQDHAGPWVSDLGTVGVSTAVRAVLESVSAWPPDRAAAAAAGSHTPRTAPPSSSQARRRTRRAGTC